MKCQHADASSIEKVKWQILKKIDISSLNRSIISYRISGQKIALDLSDSIAYFGVVAKPCRDSSGRKAKLTYDYNDENRYFYGG